MENEQDLNKEQCGGECNCNSVTPAEIGLAVDKIISLDKVENNSVIILRATREVFNNMVLALEDIYRRYQTVLREKDISVLLIDKNSDVELLSEKEMAKLGWERKSKLIITP